jgi:hypothetical protein
MFGVSVHILPADKLLLIIVVFNALITNGEANEVPLGKQRTLGLIVLIIIVVIAVEARFMHKSFRDMHNQVYYIVSTPTQDNLPRATELCSPSSRVLRTKGEVGTLINVYGKQNDRGQR